MATEVARLVGGSECHPDAGRMLPLGLGYGRLLKYQGQGMINLHDRVGLDRIWLVPSSAASANKSEGVTVF